MSLSAAPVLPFAPAGAAARRTSAAGLVSRARLVHVLMEARDLPVVTLTAPAGYGKTTTLLEWARHDERPFAWVALDSRDTDTEHLRASLARSTQGPSRRGEPFVLVIDDAHLAGADASGVLRAVAGDLAPDAQVVVASRSAPPLGLGRLRAHRELLELTASDLAMTHAEAAGLLSLAGVSLAEADVDVLMQRTEGWPAGLYLAALALRDEPDPGAAAAHFGGADRHVCDYVADAVLAELPEEQVDLLLRTSVLDRLSGPLCDAVLGGRPRAALMLRELARGSGLLVPLDHTDTWYRRHPLLTEALRAELHRRRPEAEPELHRRASRWCAEHADDPEPALGHALAAGDVALAGDLLWAALPTRLWDGGRDELAAWLQRFSAEETAGHAPLALVAANVHLARGDRDLAEHYCTAAARTLRETQADGTLQAGLALVQAAIARDGVQRMRSDAARGHRLAPPDSPWRPVALALEGTACHLLGESERAETLLREGYRRGVLAAPGVSALCLAQRALLALDADRRHEGADLAARARVQAERFDLRGEPAMAVVLAASALTAAQAGDTSRATHDARDATRLMQALADPATWYRTEVDLVLARTMIVLGDIGRARELLADADHAPAGGVTALLHAWKAAATADLEAYTGASEAVPSTLTAAELRVLQLLPSHLSFREMGLRLFVSPNTIKTQAQAIYRKLEACSRSQAVERAREVGLLDAVGAG